MVWQLTHCLKYVTCIYGINRQCSQCWVVDDGGSFWTEDRRNKQTNKNGMWMKMATLHRAAKVMQQITQTRTFQMTHHKNEYISRWNVTLCFSVLNNNKKQQNIFKWNQMKSDTFIRAKQQHLIGPKKPFHWMNTDRKMKIEHCVCLCVCVRSDWV